MSEKDLHPAVLVVVACERSFSGKRQPEIRLRSQAIVAGVPAEA